MPIIDIHSGMGGLEAKRWVASLSEWLMQYAQHKDWTVSDYKPTGEWSDEGRRVTFVIHGSNAYPRLRWFQGIHRVQREGVGALGRVQTSTAIVLVMPSDAIEEWFGDQRNALRESNEKIRTYNFLRDTVTDHRIRLTLSGLGKVATLHFDHLADELDAASGRR